MSGHDRDSFHIYFLFLTALNNKHSSQEQRNIVNEFFERLESEILPSPKDYQWPVFLEHIFSCLQIKKLIYKALE